MNLPTEILSKIFDYVSIPKYKSACSLTCHQWHLTAQLSLYHTVQLYTIKQSTGDLVKYLELNYSLLYMEPETWYALQKLCPHIIEFNYINNKYNNEILGGSGKNMDYQLEHIPAWLTRPHQRDLFKEHITLWPLLTTLPLCHVENLGKIIIQKLVSTINIDNNDDHHDPIKSPPFTYIGNILNYQEDYTSFTKTISLYQHITKLHIDFIHFNSLRDRHSMEMDCSTFFNQLDACPCLNHLSVNYLSLVIDPSSSSSSPLDDTLWKSYSAMKVLSLHHLEVKHPTCFHFLSKKYPHLITLDLELSITNALTDLLLDQPFFSDNYQQGLYHLFTHYKQLQTLWFSIEEESFEEDMLHYDRKVKLIIPSVQMMDWFEQNTTTKEKTSISLLTQLKWPCELYKDDITTTTNTTNIITTPITTTAAFISSPSILPDYLNRLTTLDITLSDHTINQQLDYFLKGQRKDSILSTSITSLRLKDLAPKFSLNGIKLNHWLNALPHLIKLELSDMEYIQYTEDYDNIHGNGNGNGKRKQYGLKELIIRKVSLYSQLGLRGAKNATITDICQLFPKLKVLKLDEVSILGSQYLNRLWHLYYHDDNTTTGSSSSNRWNEDDIILSEYIDECIQHFPIKSLTGMKNNKHHHLSYRRMCDTMPPLTILDFSHLSLDVLYLSNVRIYASLKHDDKYHYRRLLIEALHIYEQQDYKRHQKTCHFTVHSEDRDDDFNYYYNDDDDADDLDEEYQDHNLTLIPHLNNQGYGKWDEMIGSMSIAIKCHRIGQVHLHHSKKYWSAYVNETRKECFEHVFNFIETITEHRLKKNKIK
ncbi:unnamed protein product [Cunninghamella echinulata]